MAFDVVNQKGLIELDDQDDQDDDHHFLIAYDDVWEYSNKQHSTFNRYQLPSELALEGDDEIETEDGSLYSLTPTEECYRVDEDEDGGRSIDPIEWTGGDEELYVNITDVEVNTLKDKKVRSDMKRYLNGLFLDLVMTNKLYLSFKLQGCKTTCGNGLLKMDGRPSTTLVIESLLQIM
jgi:hypothetical protein